MDNRHDGGAPVMKILLTGARGMVGRNLADHPSMRQHDLLRPSRAELDLRDVQAVDDWFAAHRPDIVVHAAGTVGGIHANIREPVRFLVENLDIGRNVVMAARKYGVRRLLNLGSSCMYPHSAPNPLQESAILTGALEPTNEGYALAKVMVARLCEYITREDPSFQYKTLVPSNIYGSYDSFDESRSHLVPAIIKKIHMAKVGGVQEVEIWGDGTARREFLYAADLSDAICFVIAHFDDVPPVMNIGLGRDYSIREYYEIAARVIGYEGGFVHDMSKPVGMKQKLVDTSLQARLGWSPAHSLAQGMEKTYAYFLHAASSSPVA